MITGSKIDQQSLIKYDESQLSVYSEKTLF